jgi:hypothetical protein
MTTLLTNEDKLSIVNQHIKSIDFQIYNLELDLLEANAEATPNAENISSLNGRATSLNAKRVVLATEAAELEELKMRQQLQQDRDLLEQQRQATMETTKNEARSIMNAAQQESDKVDKKIDELRKMLAEVSSFIEENPATNS